MKNNGEILGVILLISGTTIGAGMLGLPIATGIMGFIPAICVFFLCWLIMTWSAILIVEVNFALKKNVNLISMARFTLGKSGALVTWVAFLGLYYTLLAAYISISGHMFFDLINIFFFNENIINMITPLIILILTVPFIIAGIKYVDYFNRILTFILILTYFLLIIILIKHINPPLLLSYQNGFFINSFAIVIVSFGFHPIIPTITHYLKYKIKNVIFCIVIGSLIPLLIYILWELVLLGIIPISSITHAYNKEINFCSLIQLIINNPWITSLIWTFSLFAILTSFMGVAVSSLEFLKDGLKLKNTSLNFLKLYIIIFIPPLLFTYIFKNGFIEILNYAGIFLIVLAGIIPILMIYKLKYYFKHKLFFPFISNKILLSAGMISYLIIIIFIFIKNN